MFLFGGEAGFSVRRCTKSSQADLLTPSASSQHTFKSLFEDSAELNHMQQADSESV